MQLSPKNLPPLSKKDKQAFDRVCSAINKGILLNDTNDPKIGCEPLSQEVVWKVIWAYKNAGWSNVIFVWNLQNDCYYFELDFFSR